MDINRDPVLRQRRGFRFGTKSEELLIPSSGFRAPTAPIGQVMHGTPSSEIHLPKVPPIGSFSIPQVTQPPIMQPTHQGGRTPKQPVDLLGSYPYVGNTPAGVRGYMSTEPIIRGPTPPQGYQQSSFQMMNPQVNWHTRQPEWDPAGPESHAGFPVSTPTSDAAGSINIPGCPNRGTRSHSISHRGSINPLPWPTLRQLTQFRMRRSGADYRVKFSILRRSLSQDGYSGTPGESGYPSDRGGIQSLRQTNPYRFLSRAEQYLSSHHVASYRDCRVSILQVPDEGILQEPVQVHEQVSNAPD